jgi:hypothetical protein
MKNIIAVCFLLSCGVVVLLATVDLAPYLAPESAGLPKNVHLPAASGPDKPPLQTELPTQEKTLSTALPSPEQTVYQVDQSQSETVPPEEMVENSTPAATVDQSTPAEEQTASFSPAEAEEVAQGTKPEQLPPDLIELEVEILPVGEYPFSILLNTFAEQATAEKAIPYYQERGISAHWVKVNLGAKGIHYRLFTGVFRTIPEAQQYLDRKKLVDRLIKPTYYSARVGIYQERAQLASMFVKTRDTRVVPYILGTKNGDYHLYVGAFYTFIGAVDQCRELTAAGISCEPAKRSTLPPQ